MAGLGKRFLLINLESFQNETTELYPAATGIVKNYCGELFAASPDWVNLCPNCRVDRHRKSSKLLSKL
jgi:hypothetical protein